MDSDVLDVMRELGCYSAHLIDDAGAATTDCDEQGQSDELSVDLGGEG